MVLSRHPGKELSGDVHVMVQIGSLEWCIPIISRILVVVGLVGPLFGARASPVAPLFTSNTGYMVTGCK